MKVVASFTVGKLGKCYLNSPIRKADVSHPPALLEKSAYFLLCGTDIKVLELDQSTVDVLKNRNVHVTKAGAVEMQTYNLLKRYNGTVTAKAFLKACPVF